MKKFVLALGLTLMLIWGWPGYSGFGAAPAHGQPPGYYDPYYCDPNYYTNCYSAPYVDPNAQYFLYYTIPRFGEELEEEHERHEYYEHRGREGHERHEHFERH